MADGVGTGGPIPVAPDIDPNDADTVATTPDKLEREATSGSGKIIWIPGDARIDFTGRSIVTQNIIASNRSNQHPGGMIYTNDMGDRSAAYNGGAGVGMITLEGVGRTSGLRLRGPTYDYWDHPKYPGFIEQKSASEYTAMLSRGITILSSQARVDNCEIYGFSTQGIVVGAKEIVANPAIHYNAIHNNMQTHYGYGVDVKRGMPHIFRCWFDAHRHAINGFGYADSSYLVEECTIGPHTSSHVIDMHGVHNNSGGSSNPSAFNWRFRAGGTMRVINSSVMALETIPPAWPHGGSRTELMHIRGVPKNGAILQGNQFAHPGPPDGNNGVGTQVYQSTIPSGVATNALGYVNIEWEGNQWNLDFDDDGQPGVAMAGDQASR